MEPITLTTDRLRLRNPVPGDADAVYAICQDPAILRWTTVPDPYTRQDAEFFLNRLVPDGWREDTDYSFLAEPLAGGPPLAAASLKNQGSGTWEIGYWLAPDHRGHGYMTEIARALAHWAFTGLGCTRLVWRAEVGNTGSRAVAERTGFVMEGVQRAGLPNKGTLRDCWTGALLPSDFGLPSPLPYLPAPGLPSPGLPAA
ncbi:GNAT family N-acetyltransferase [Streptomyces sp. NPDC057242]|uniref:GNAT family N-acetyltransferase n=1 Tax=unclassified Streptomyces TaxID=2593676 RepID=UPI0036395C45